jgi:simple sugar transport system ATP-binding protein
LTEELHPLLETRGISKRFGGVLALNDVSIDVAAGEVQCLVGENGCGKSTLIKILAGVVTPDRGSITVGEVQYGQLTPRQAIDAGIQVIFQDFSLFPSLSVAENIAIPTYVAGGRWIVRSSDGRRLASETIARVGVELDLDARVAELTVADRQLTAICRALARDPKLIFLDEPTTALTWREVDALFRVVESLKARGVAVVFVSHKIEEVFRISDRITVMRNGAVVARGATHGFDRASLVRAMTGRTLAASGPTELDAAQSTPSLSVDGLGLSGRFTDISFSVYPGEVLGLTGLLGSGRTEIAEALFGIVPADRGRVSIDGQAVQIRTVRDAIAAGIGYVPGDRLTQGVFLDQSIARNIIASNIDRLIGRLDAFQWRAAQAMVERAFRELHIVAASPDAPVRSLSGGNQQRVVLAKWLARSLRVLILNSPTVGVDVGSHADILELLRTKSREGLAIVVISDDVPELLAVCHRVIVIRRGRMARELRGTELSEHAILQELAA